VHSHLFQLELLFNGCPILAYALLKVIVESLLLDAFLELCLLLVRQITEPNLILESVDANFKQETFGSI